MAVKKRRIMISVDEKFNEYLEKKSDELGIPMSGVVMVALGRMMEQEKAQEILFQFQTNALQKIYIQQEDK